MKHICNIHNTDQKISKLNARSWKDYSYSFLNGTIGEANAKETSRSLGAMIGNASEKHMSEIILLNFCI